MAAADEGNRFLRQARSMSFDTPEKTEKPVDSKGSVKTEIEEKLKPPQKKLCTSFEKFQEEVARGYINHAGTFAVVGRGDVVWSGFSCFWKKWCIFKSIR